MGREKLKYYTRGYSPKSHKKKRIKEINLPKLNRFVEVYPRFTNGNEKLHVRKGMFIAETKHLLFLKPLSKAGKLEAFSKTDLINKIYIYNYIN